MKLLDRLIWITHKLFWGTAAVYLFYLLTMVHTERLMKGVRYDDLGDHRLELVLFVAFIWAVMIVRRIQKGYW